jgi:hypothetical protein
MKIRNVLSFLPAILLSFPVLASPPFDQPPYYRSDRLVPAVENRLEVVDYKLMANIKDMKQLVAIVLGVDPDSLGEFAIDVSEKGDHWWVQFFDELTGEDTGCHDIDNMQSCEGSCPCR